MKTIIVIPTYNEKENAGILTKKIFALNITNLELLFVDDCSPDGTAEVIKNLQKTHPIHLIEREKKLGLGSAYVAGFKMALELGADYVFEMDADLSHDPSDIPKLLNVCQNGADLAIGSRKITGGGIEGWNWERKLMSDSAMWFARSILGLKTKDVTAGFRCFKRQVLENIDLKKIKSNGYAFQEELLFRTQKNGFTIV
ncbi:MAG: polyprenol monophosphomannose synthase, partial [bacterium]